jgi:molybdate transport system substrate-binding protein
MARRTRQKNGASVVCLACLLALFTDAQALAEQALVAVATNFAEVAQHLESDFEVGSGHEITLATGSTGKLYAQIINGAPYDLLLAADQERPRLLEQSGDAVAGTRAVYAIGRLTLWSVDADHDFPLGLETLEKGEFRSLAIANPRLAPYGAAAKETLQSLSLWEALESKIVMGENIGQAHAMVATGSAELGMVALSYVLSPRNRQPGTRWDIPADLHAPIRQDAVLLTHGAGNVAATAFLEFLQTAGVRTTVKSFGYDIE